MASMISRCSKMLRNRYVRQANSRRTKLCTPLQDFRRVKEVDPSRAREMDGELARMAAKRKAGDAKQRQQFRNFFDRNS